MAWIESHTVLRRHRKTKDLARLLRLKPVHLMGHLHALWHDALEQQEDGDLSAWSDELIAESSDYNGDAPQYVRLLQQTGWLDGKIIHDWLEYAGRYLESKYRTSNPSRLMDIWAIHGLVYLKTDRSQPKDSPDKRTLPNQPNQPETPPARVPYQEIQAIWNENCGVLAKVTAVSESRKKHVKARWEEKPDLTYWRAVVVRLARSAFATGKNDRGWKASFDFVIENDGNHLKVMEGKYDDHKPASTAITPRPYIDPVKNIKPEDLLTAEDIERAKLAAVVRNKAGDYV